MSRCSVHRLLALFLFAASCSNARADEARGLVTIGMQRVFEEMKPAFEAASGQKLNAEFTSTPDLVKRVQDGERADFVISSRAGIDGLIKSGNVTADNHFALVGSPIAVAVPAGHPKPDVSTAKALKNALLAARAISYTDPASGGPSGIHFARVLEHLAISDEIRAKTKFPPAGGLVGEILARGGADIGIQQMAELSSFNGVDVVGTLPDDFQSVTEYAVAIPANAVHPEAG
jgi:molybdate transport system substrate-binding protein